MAETFGGIQSVNPPALKGVFVPGIDNPDIANGFGLYIPLGGGSTSRKYDEYGASSESNALNTQLWDIAGSMFGWGSDGISSGMTGADGPPGPMGPPGPPGLVTIQQILYPIGSMDYDDMLAQLITWGATTDTIVYGGDTHIEWNEPWTRLNVYETRAWNGSALNEDGSFMLIASDLGVHVSTDSGENWSLETPAEEDFLCVDVEADGGNAVALGEDNQVNGSFWATANYGASWTKITISTT
jgi:hypothetical protein